MSYYKRYIVYDLETGGLVAKRHAITEIAMIALDGDTLEEVGRYEVLIAPYDALYTQEAADISEISYEMLEKEGVSIEEAFDGLLDFLDEQKIGSMKPVLVGHNIKKFDNDFLDEQLFKRFNKKMSKYVNDYVVDTLEESRRKFKDAAKHTLGAACAEVGVVMEQAHRAMADAMANSKLFVKMEQGGGNTEVKKKKRIDFYF